MSQPINVDIPHKLGKSGARARIEGGIGSIGDKIPGGAAVERRWDGDTMHFTVQALGQSVRAELTVFEDKVHALIDLPAFLSLFSAKVKDVIEAEGPKLLR